MSRLKAKLAAGVFRLKPEIKGRFGNQKYRAIKDSFEEQYAEIDARTAKEKGIMAFHRMFLITGLALYQSLGDEFRNQQELIAEVHQILWAGGMEKMVRRIAFFIRRSKDPFRSYLKILGPNNEWFFPCPPWEKEVVEIQNGMGWYQKKCPFVEFFKKEGLVELTKAYCDMDHRTAENFSEQLELKREKAMSKGDERCDFLYYRKSPVLS